VTAQVDPVRLAQVFVVELAFRHRQMVRLMMRAAHQYANKAGAANVLHFIRAVAETVRSSPFCNEAAFVLHP
jgi:hypothetical protein